MASVFKAIITGDLYQVRALQAAPTSISSYGDSKTGLGKRSRKSGGVHGCPRVLP